MLICTRAMNLLMRIGCNIRTLRERRGWTQQQLADASGLNRTYLGLVERGVKNISILSLAQIADALDVEPHKLLQALDTDKGNN